MFVYIDEFLNVNYELFLFENRGLDIKNKKCSLVKKKELAFSLNIEQQRSRE